MKPAPHRVPIPVDQDGVPKEIPDETPMGNENRPKRKEVDWWANTTFNMKRFNTLEWHEEKLAGWEKNPAPYPKVQRPIPEPRFGMTLEKFLKKIGRMSDQYLPLFRDWDHFWSCKSEQFKILGITTIADRKYILRQMNYYRLGQEPRFIPLRSKAKKNRNLPWRLALITQKEKRIELGLDDE